jgi:hypothetical protein
MTTYEYRVLLNEELYVNNTEDVLHEIRSMAFGQFKKEVKNADREKMELEVGVLDEKTLTRTIRVTYRDEKTQEDTDLDRMIAEEPEDLEYCENCAESFNYCVCGDQALPTEPDVEAIV